MSLSNTDLQSALDKCAAEPVHIPGNVQPSGCLLGVDIESGQIKYVSENSTPILGLAPGDLLDASLEDQLGREVVHALRCATVQPRFQTQPIPIGLFRINDRNVMGYASIAANQAYRVVEFERVTAEDLNENNRFDALNALIASIHDCETQPALFSLTVDLAQKLSGYDRVMIYRFDLDYNGEVIAENKPDQMETFLGLRFPSHDIPPQARALMAKLPIRFISDVFQTPVPLCGADSDLPPLNISAAYARGVSPVHLEYLGNMGIQSTMTLSVVIDGTLWGMISFHHQQPKVPAASVRSVLTQFGKIFAAKLDALRQKEMLTQVKQVEALKDQLLIEIDDSEDRDSYFAKIAPRMSEVIPVAGIALKVNATIQTFGKTPSDEVLIALQERTRVENLEILKSQDLFEQLQLSEADSTFTGGALVYLISPNRAIYLFREAIAQEIHWAGNPEKTLESVSGRIRLAPRGSFASYLEKVAGTCPPWTDDDVFFARRLGAIVNSSERQDMLQSLTRKQSVVIDELNHRVRNILALVQSISHQTRRHHHTLDSYAGSLEARIQALAMVHNIARETTAQSVSLRRIIMEEFAPYRTDETEKAVLTGPDAAIKADVAPVLSLVLHELATNAAKYGALATSSGRVTINIRQTETGYTLLWTESGGPPVNIPNDRGFGSSLIEDAVPHELNGTSKLIFDPSGVRAEIFLPVDLFDTKASSETNVLLTRSAHQAESSVMMEHAKSLPKRVRDGIVLIVEDDFIIAKELSDMLKDFGFKHVVPFSNVDGVMDYLEGQTPALALLDVNLGIDRTSKVAALRLQKIGVPLVFITGFSERANLPGSLSDVPKLNKPLQASQLHTTLSALFNEPVRHHDTPLPHAHS